MWMVLVVNGRGVHGAAWDGRDVDGASPSLNTCRTTLGSPSIACFARRMRIGVLVPAFSLALCSPLAHYAH